MKETTIGKDTDIDLIKNRLQESLEVKTILLNDHATLKVIELVANEIVKSLESGGKVIFAGNGGSFSDAFHLVGEFVSRFLFDRDPLAAIALGGNNATLSATGNDYGYEYVFYRELKALSKPNDVFIPISTSGNSKNILRAVEFATQNGIKVFGLTGLNGGLLGKACQCILIPSDSTPRIQEGHITVGHIICELVEAKLFKQ